jgi:RNA polymerase sigma-70 factor (ECF subfamily)
LSLEDAYLSNTPNQGGDASDLTSGGQTRPGQRLTFEELLKRYWSPLVAYAADILGARDEAKDVVQDTYIRLWQRRAEWTSVGSMSAYLYRITRNLSLNARRDRDLRRQRDGQAGVEMASSVPSSNPQLDLEATSLREEVEAAIDSLPERRREVFRLSRFHGLSHREIADSLGISPQTVSNQMTSALDQLRERLSHHLQNL